MFDTIIRANAANIKYGFISKKELTLRRNDLLTNLLELNKYNTLQHITPKVNQIALLNQHHGNMCYIRENDTHALEGDGQVTITTNLPLAVYTADCVPIIFYDAFEGVIGIAHAGWKGALAGIINSTVIKMCKLKAELSNIVAIIGPCIQQESYEVDENFYGQFMKQSENNKLFFINSKKHNHYMFDLPGYCKLQLQQQGLTNITDINSCTYKNEELWFSYRRCTHKNMKKTDGHILSYIVKYD